jgi:flagellar biosynthesis activator protein FlaF
MQYAASAYARVAQATQSPRELEANVLLKAASRLQAIGDDWAGRRAELDDALTYNRKLWTILVTSVTDAESALPQAIKNNIANLGLFVFHRTMDIVTAPAPEKLGVLVNINRELAAGLRGQAPAANAA